MKDKDILLRSMLFVPGNSERFLLSASQSNADALIMDLEDSVQPEDNKEIARALIKSKVEEGIFDKYTMFVRINDADSGHLIKDILALTIDGIDGFMFPKPVSSKDIIFFDKLLSAVEADKGFEKGTFSIVPLIETAGAVLNAQDICMASQRVVAIAFGCEDFVADVEGVHTSEGESLLTPRALIAMAARSAGVIPIDTVHIDVHNLEDFERNAKLANRLGFEGNLLLHPKEIDVANRCYAPTEQEVSDAQEMLSLATAAQDEGKGVAVMNGRFVGPPLIRAAKSVLRRQQRILNRGDRS
jgi:citrate lyase subunit beta/citryl-CoA lyase